MHLTASYYLGIKLASAALVVGLVAELEQISGVCLEKGSGIESKNGLLPHFHDEVVAVKGVLALLLSIFGESSEHGVDADHFVVVRAVHVQGLSLFLLPFLEGRGGFFGDARATTANTFASHRRL